jgi:hypothetical protein
MNMDENASKWLEVYKLKHGLGTWSDFIAAVESQFGTYDYRDYIYDLLTLEQDGPSEDYTTTFTDLQYQVSMHNMGLDEVFFVTQFVKGLKPDIRGPVQSQAPDTVKRAIMLAKIQQQLSDNKKLRQSKFSSFKYNAPTSKTDSKSSSSSTGPLWKE